MRINICTNKIKYFIILLVLASLLTACGSGHRISFTSIVSGDTVFKIGDTKCKSDEAYVYIANYKNLYGFVDGQSLWDPDSVNAVLKKAVKDAALSSLKRVYIYSLYADNLGIELSSEDKSICKKAASEYYASLSSYEKRYMGTSKKKLASMYERLLLAERVYNSLLSDIDTDLSEDACRVVDAHVIFVTDKDTADLINEAIINKTTKFQLLASTYSEAPEYEVFVTRGMYDKEVEDVVFSLEDSEISDCIATEDGYYFFRCVSKYDTEKSEENKNNIIAARQEQALDIASEYVLTNNYSQMNDQLWDSIEVDDSEKITTNTFFFTLFQNVL